MTQASSLAGVITAIGACLTAIALVINAITARRRDLRIERKVDEAVKVGAETHTIVNQERTDRMNYQRALIRALEAKGIAVPVDQSIDPGTP
jgi:hypothetical protein